MSAIEQELINSTLKAWNFNGAFSVITDKKILCKLRNPYGASLELQHGTIRA